MVPAWQQRADAEDDEDCAGVDAGPENIYIILVNAFTNRIVKLQYQIY